MWYLTVMTIFKKLFEIGAKPAVNFERFEKLGNFRVTSSISIGGHEEEIKIDVLNGEYECFYFDVEGYREEMEDQGKDVEINYSNQLILVHKNFGADVKQLFNKRLLVGKFPVEGAQFVAYDSEMNREQTFMKNLIYEHMGIIQNRGIRIGLEGDSTAEVFTMNLDDRVVGICINA